MSERQRRPRVLRHATVVRTEQLSPALVRVHLRGPDLTRIEPSAHTDRYVKLAFTPQGSPGGEVVTRTYTIRSLDTARGEMAIDFVVHGDEGLAGPWAAAARPGDEIGFFGPGGGWGPSPDADHHLLVGDESAAPAIAAALDAMPLEASATVFLEVADASSHLPLRTMPQVDVTWVHRDEHAGSYGAGLVEAVRGWQPPAGEVHVFVHGNADMVKPMRRHLLVELAIPRERASISGYWRTGQTEDLWQATKREFVAQMAAEQDAAAS